eukprot:m.85077 g.85077  ORF g.85077 m.85077 type:complete len:180 (-) comp14829_c0_seq2:543-1082(-)
MGAAPRCFTVAAIDADFPPFNQDEDAGSAETAGYLTMVLNTLDNFTHGLAVAAAFCMGPQHGWLTTGVIIMHEIAHEMGDFAILMRSGFSKKSAILVQLGTSVGGLAGTFVGLTIEGVGRGTLWILPFTAGGFLYIALSSLVPELLEGRSKGSGFAGDVLLYVLGGVVLVGAAICIPDE